MKTGWIVKRIRCMDTMETEALTASGNWTTEQKYAYIFRTKKDASFYTRRRDMYNGKQAPYVLKVDYTKRSEMVAL